MLHSSEIENHNGLLLKSYSMENRHYSAIKCRISPQNVNVAETTPDFSSSSKQFIKDNLKPSDTSWTKTLWLLKHELQIHNAQNAPKFCFLTTEVLYPHSWRHDTDFLDKNTYHNTKDIYQYHVQCHAADNLPLRIFMPSSTSLLLSRDAVKKLVSIRSYL